MLLLSYFMPLGVFGVVLGAATVDGIPIVQVGPTALAGLAVLMVLTGRLVTYPMYRDKCKQVEALVDENQFLRDQCAVKDGQLRVVSEVGATVERVMHAIESAPYVQKGAPS